MFSHVLSASVLGIDAYLVNVAAHLESRTPKYLPSVCNTNHDFSAAMKANNQLWGRRTWKRLQNCAMANCLSINNEFVILQHSNENSDQWRYLHLEKLKTIIVDDGRLVREDLKALLADYSEVEVIGEASTVDQAVRLISEVHPDVIFLDIQLHAETGFDLLEKADISSKIIFITAYDQYAIRAFEVNALDYLLKPIRKERLTKAIQKLIPDEEISIGPHEKISNEDVIYLLINGSLKFVKVKSLKCIVAEGKYSYIFYGDNKKDLVSKTLQEWETILPEKYFVRIHRSSIVNFEHVDKVEKCKNYTHKVYISGLEEPFIISRRYAVRLKKNLSW